MIRGRRDKQVQIKGDLSKASRQMHNFWLPSTADNIKDQQQQNTIL